jgi:hypothetical protein
MRRGKSLLGQTISLCCTRPPRFRMTLYCQTDLGSLMRLAGTPILVLCRACLHGVAARGSRRCDDVEVPRIPRNKSGRRSVVDWSWFRRPFHSDRNYGEGVTLSKSLGGLMLSFVQRRGPKVVAAKINSALISELWPNAYNSGRPSPKLT